MSRFDHHFPSSPAGLLQAPQAGPWETSKARCNRKTILVPGFWMKYDEINLAMASCHENHPNSKSLEDATWLEAQFYSASIILAIERGAHVFGRHQWPPKSNISTVIFNYRKSRFPTGKYFYLFSKSNCSGSGWSQLYLSTRPYEIRTRPFLKASIFSGPSPLLLAWRFLHERRIAYLDLKGRGFPELWDHPGRFWKGFIRFHPTWGHVAGGFMKRWLSSPRGDKDPPRSFHGVSGRRKLPHRPAWLPQDHWLWCGWEGAILGESDLQDLKLSRLANPSHHVIMSHQWWLIG